MSPIRSASIAVLASAVLATTLTGCGIGGEPQDTSPIVIAADLELSGAYAPIGKVYQPLRRRGIVAEHQRFQR
ncbi:hypothetical protein GCM10027452_31280 [Micromonospora halotolerans]